MPLLTVNGHFDLDGVGLQPGDYLGWLELRVGQMGAQRVSRSGSSLTFRGYNWLFGGNTPRTTMLVGDSTVSLHGGKTVRYVTSVGGLVAWAAPFGLLAAAASRQSLAAAFGIGVSVFLLSAVCMYSYSAIMFRRLVEPTGNGRR